MCSEALLRQSSRTAGAVVAICALSWPARSGATEDMFRLEAGPYFASYSALYGNWYGAAARFWVLDSEGTRGFSGYVNIVDLHWDAPRLDDDGGQHATFFMGRLMKHWSKGFYTVTTLGATAFDPVFPRVQVENEFNFLPPQIRGSAVSIGAGDRYYPVRNRPYLVFGASYATPRTSLSYRYWVGRGLSQKTSDTHLLTWAYGARLDFWARIDLLWGDEAHSTGTTYDISVESRSIAFTLEKWIGPHIGFMLSPELTEIAVLAPAGATLHRFQTVGRLFATF